MIFNDDRVPKDLCFNCMKIKNGERVCPNCGYVNKKQSRKKELLRQGDILNNRFIIGKVLCVETDYIAYIAYDNSLMHKIIIKEYYPHKLVQRNCNMSMSLKLKMRKSKFKNGLDNFLSEAVTLTKNAGSQNVESAYQIINKNNTAYIILEYNEKNVQYISSNKNFKDFKTMIHNIPKGIMVLFFLIMIVFIIFLSSILESTKMPQVIGMQYDNAVYLLESLNIRYETISVFSPKDIPNLVIGQEIPEGTIINKKNSPVTIIRNFTFTIPRLINRTVDYAVDVLENDGYAYKVIPVMNAEYSPDRVIDQKPEPGNYPANNHILVMLYVSEAVPMPKIVGIPYYDAIRSLQEFNILYDVDIVCDIEKTDNIIIFQTPEPGIFVVNFEDRVTITVNDHDLINVEADINDR